MTLATSCPACGTVFKIVEDQLKVSEGWVRCGHCQDVFNALEGLFDLAGRERPPLSPPPSPATTARSGVPRGARASSGVSTRGSLSAPADSDLGPSPRDRSDNRGGSVWDLAAARQHEQAREITWQQRLQVPGGTGEDPVGAEPRPRRPSDERRGPASTRDPAPDRPEAGRPSAGEPEPVRPPPADEPVEVIDLSEADTVFLAHEPGSSFADPFESIAPGRAQAFHADPVEGHRPRPDGSIGDAVSASVQGDGAGRAAASAPPEPMPALPTFVREADRAARWRRPGMRAALALGCLCAAATLTLQVLVQHRDGAAARWPGLRAPLAALCEPLGCNVQAPRQLDALVVENTALTRPAGVEGYRLQLLLRNHAEFAVLAPHVELSLTDAGGGVVVRRVISPTDFHQPDTLPGNSEGNWQLELTSSDKRVAGYTVAVFYP